ncbi:hypothetical protein [Devosia indica]|uniref:hypothetical protein n=1 Tax=Devosia indica TaxID=2079253 RepID=UPI000D3D4CE9|nr:hypothetical protein [Devosia indica]
MIRAFGPTEFLFLLEGARWTILLSLVAFAGGGVGGLILALLRISPSPWLRMPAQVFNRNASDLRILRGLQRLNQLQ